MHRQPDRRGRARLAAFAQRQARRQWSRSRPTRSAGRCWRARRAEAGVVYSLAFGDQPALICDLVDWARACGFPVVAAGRGHKWLPHFAQSTPETVWGYYGLTPEQAQARRPQPEDVQLASSTAPSPRSRAPRCATRPASRRRRNGLLYPPASVDDIPSLMRPTQRRRRAASQGPGRGDLLARDGRHADPVRHPLRRVGRVRGRDRVHPQLLQEYGVHTDPSGPLLPACTSAGT